MRPSSAAPEFIRAFAEDVRWALIDRIAASSHFRASARLREFLFYIADCAIRNAPEEATEQQIGFRVFHRSPGYNSSEDSIVRTHARLLRQKLAAYYLDEGLDEELIVEVPKGHYLPVFAPRTSPIKLPAEPAIDGIGVIEEKPSGMVLPPVVLQRVPKHTHLARLAGRWWLGALILLLAFAVVAGSLLWRRPPTTAVERFWKPFFNGEPPLVVFSNALFVGDSKSGLSYASQFPEAGKPADQDLVDTYTGIGELSAVYTLTSLFDAHHEHFILKRSRLMTWDEAKVRNLIFIGSTAENPSLSALQSTREFTITATHEYSGYVNHHPKAGEPAIYSRPERPLTNDYAILALLPGMQPGERILIFSGLNTFGTQAAVEFACRPETVAELLRQVTGPKGEILPFEALIETNITGGVPVQAKLVTVHLR